MRWLLRVRAAGLIVPVWLDDALVIFHNDSDNDTRLSGTREWLTLYQWAIENQERLLTSQAFAYCLVRFCLPRAKRSATPMRDSWLVISSAISGGRTDLRFWTLLAAHAVLSVSLRRTLRNRYAHLSEQLRQVFFKWKNATSHS